jgi:hypothetical protein
VLLLLLAGCAGQSSEDRSRTVCTAFCECFTTAGEVDACVDDCVPDLPDVSDDCLQCVYANSQTCSVLENDCLPECDP